MHGQKNIKLCKCACLQLPAHTWYYRITYNFLLKFKSLKHLKIFRNLIFYFMIVGLSPPLVFLFLSQKFTKHIIDIH